MARIGIDFRILAVGNELITRGMGRFTQQQLAAVLEADGENEYVLLCSPDPDLSLLKPEIRAAPNVAVRCPPRSLGRLSPTDGRRVLEYAARYEEWVATQDVDLFHCTTPFFLEEPGVVELAACPMVTTFYDVIPLVFPAQYLTGWVGRDRYMRALNLVVKATRLMAISSSARDDAASYLGFPPARTDIVFPVAEPCFRPMAEATAAQVLDGLRRRLDVPDRFALAVTHVHYGKNVETLLRGYAMLPPGFRRQLPLVLACQLDEHGEHFLRSTARRLGVDDVVLTGLVSDEELAGLYNAASLVVHPSRYEGFGLPVVEAMQCGTPVITTTASSLPEVAGGAAVLVDPDDACAFAQAIQELFEDPARREELRARGLERAGSFTTTALAETTLASYRRTLSADGASPGRPRIAVWTPLPPQETGVADYSFELLGRLERDHDVEVFVDDGYLPPDDLLLRWRIRNFRAFEHQQRQRPFDVVLYQVGGSMFHLYMYPYLQRHPGVVVLHDLMWSHVLYTRHNDADDVETFRREVARTGGEEALADFDAAQADYVTNGDATGLWRFFTDHPMLGGLVDASRAVVVHMDAARLQVEKQTGVDQVHTIPMGVGPMGVVDPGPGRAWARVQRARSRVGVGPTTLVVGVFGAVHPTKRVDACIGALPDVLAAHPDTVLLVVGGALERRHEDKLRQLASDLGVAANVRFTGRIGRDGFDAHLLACDVVVNLRLPTATHMSATLLRAVAAGKPVVISDLEAWSFVPDDLCLRVPTDDREPAVLAAHLRTLATEPTLRQRMGSRARRYYVEEASIELMARRYAELLGRLAADGNGDRPLEPVG